MDHYKLKPVRSKDWITYRCSQCGQCCRHVKDSIMLESLDAYRLARHFQSCGHVVTEIQDIFHQYCDPIPLMDNGYPVFVLKTTGADESCIFLEHGGCSIYQARPRVCRLYPFSAGPGQRGRDFEYYLCMDKQKHFSDSRVSVNDWFYNNFKHEEKEFIKREFQNISVIGGLMRQVPSSGQDRVIMLLLHYLYYNYDSRQPFLPQHEHNYTQLISQLQTLV